MAKPNSERQRPVMWPRDLRVRYGISITTLWRWERSKKLPPRDVYIGGVPEGWRAETIEAAERGQQPAA